MIADTTWLRREMARALMRQSDGKCTCPGPKTRMYYERDGVPEGEKPSDRCENCGGLVQVVCLNIVSEWRSGAE
jgi:hypothetical protein